MFLFEVHGYTNDARCCTSYQVRFISADTKDEARTIATSSPIRMYRVTKILRIQ